jgi:predicted solute-binding protein
VVRLGAVSYLNAGPLVWGLENEPGYRLLRDNPARIAGCLHEGGVDLGMIPSIEYAFGRYAIVPGIGIGSRGAVQSVLLFHSRPLDEVRRVALDTSSRTSAALVRILLRERLGRDPEYVPMAPSLADMLARADAALLIGDAALDHPEEAPPCLDLGEEWTRLTGMPFVYAFWAGPATGVTPAVVRRLQSALAEGQGVVAAIAAAHANGAPGRVPAYEEYLRRRIVYRLGEAELAGLREFYRRAHGLGLIPSIPELRFHADH